MPIAKAANAESYKCKMQLHEKHFCFSFMRILFTDIASTRDKNGIDLAWNERKGLFSRRARGCKCVRNAQGFPGKKRQSWIKLYVVRSRLTRFKSQEVVRDRNILWGTVRIDKYFYHLERESAYAGAWDIQTPEKSSLYVVGRGKPQQEQNSPNHIQRLFLGSVYLKLWHRLTPARSKW